MPNTLSHQEEISRLYTMIDNLQICVLNLTSRIVELERVRTQQLERDNIRSTLQQITELQTLIRNTPRNLSNSSNLNNLNSINEPNENNRTQLNNRTHLNNINSFDTTQNRTHTNNVFNTPRRTNHLRNLIRPLHQNETYATTPDPNSNNINNNQNTNNNTQRNTNYYNNTTTDTINPLLNALNSTQEPQTTTSRTFQNTNNGVVETLEFTFSNPPYGTFTNDSLENLFTNIFNNQNSTNQPLSLSNLNHNTTLFTYNQNFRDNNTQTNELNQNEEVICTICRDTFTEGIEIRQLNHCGHYYHRNCIDTWFERHNSCPYCRHNLSQNTPSNSLNRTNISPPTSTSSNAEQV
jgi:hypothetical protein